MKLSYCCECSEAKSEKDKVFHQPHGSPQELLSSFLISCFCQTTYFFLHILVRKSHVPLLLADRDVKNSRFLFSFWVLLSELLQVLGHWQKADLALRLVVPAKQSLKSTLPSSFQHRKNFVIPKIILKKKKKGRKNIY